MATTPCPARSHGLGEQPAAPMSYTGSAVQAGDAAHPGCSCGGGCADRFTDDLREGPSHAITPAAQKACARARQGVCRAPGPRTQSAPGSQDAAERLGLPTDEGPLTHLEKVRETFSE